MPARRPGAASAKAPRLGSKSDRRSSCRRSENGRPRLLNRHAKKSPITCSKDGSNRHESTMLRPVGGGGLCPVLCCAQRKIRPACPAGTRERPRSEQGHRSTASATGHSRQNAGGGSPAPCGGRLRRAMSGISPGRQSRRSAGSLATLGPRWKKTAAKEQARHGSRLSQQKHGKNPSRRSCGRQQGHGNQGVLRDVRHDPVCCGRLEARGGRATIHRWQRLRGRRCRVANTAPGTG